MSQTLSKVVSISCGLLDSVRDVKILNSSMFMGRSSSLIMAKKDNKKRWGFLSLTIDIKISCSAQEGLESTRNFPLISNLLENPVEVAASAEQKVHDLVLKQASLLRRRLISSGDLDVKPDIVLPAAGNYLSLLTEAYDRCGEICAEHSKSYYLGTLLMTPERRKAIWAIYVWASRTDELVDGHNASHMTPTALDRWESRLEDLFRGRPFDMLDAALSDTVSRLHIDIQPFKDMIEGMRMDMRKCRYKNFDELYLYCYHVAGTVGLMCLPVMGISSDSTASMESVCQAALALGIANQLTNILRDVGEDAGMGRIYLPQDELAEAGLSDDDIFAGKVTDKWRNFMKTQIQRAKLYFDAAEKGVRELNEASRWPLWTSILLYRKLLEEIEANDYNNFTKKASLSEATRLLFLPMAYARSFAYPSRK